MRKVTLRLGVLALAAFSAAVFASSAFGQNYVVLYRSHAVPADAAQRISSAGGTLVYGYGQIGVGVAVADPLESLQWDMTQIHAPEAHAITGDSPSIVVADLDTGLDFTHPDLAANYAAPDNTDSSRGAPTPR